MERRTGFAALVSELSFRRVGLLSEAGGPYLLGLGSQRWRLRLSFRRFEVRLGAGVIRSQSVLSLAGSGFGPPSRDLIPRFETFQGSCGFRALSAAALDGFAAGGAAFRRSPARDQTRLNRSRRNSRLARSDACCR